jgi:hypothetical protein
MITRYRARSRHVAPHGSWKAATRSFALLTPPQHFLDDDDVLTILRPIGRPLRARDVLESCQFFSGVMYASAVNRRNPCRRAANAQIST